MKILVTGGAGFIGSSIAREAVRRGHTVFVLDDFSHPSDYALPQEAIVIRADVRTSGTLIAASGADVVVHAAAQVSVPDSVARPEYDADINVRGTLQVAEGVSLGGTAHMIFLSSGGAIYGERKRAWESDDPTPDSPYGEHKLVAERLIGATCPTATILRLSNVYGPGNRDSVVDIVERAILAETPITLYGHGKQTRDFVHVDDVVTAIFRSILRRPAGIYNISSGRETEIEVLPDVIATALGRGVPPINYAAKLRPGDVWVSSMSHLKFTATIGWDPVYRLDGYGDTGPLLIP